MVRSSLLDAANSAPELRINVEVRTVSGDLLADMNVSLEETVGDLKQRALLSRGGHTGRDARYAVLICGSWSLKDYTRMSDCPGVDLVQLQEGRHGALTMTIVQHAPSSLAAHLLCLEEHGLELGGISDVADSVFQAEHELSLRRRPGVNEVLAAISQEWRSSVVAWMSVACNAAALSDEVLFGATLTFDRYVALQEDNFLIVDTDRTQKVLLACLSAEMKLASDEEITPGCWLRTLTFLYQGHQLQDILHVEAAILRSLDFTLGIPTPLTFLNGLGLRLCSQPGGPDFDDGDDSKTAALKLILAHILLELALYDVHLLYSFPPVALAAGALGAAILTVGMPAAGERTGSNIYVNGLRNLKAQRERLLRDVSSYCPGDCNIQGPVRMCEEEMLHLWQASREPTAMFHQCFQLLLNTHQRGRRMVATGMAEELGERLKALSPADGLERRTLLLQDGEAGAATGSYGLRATTTAAAAARA